MPQGIDVIREILRAEGRGVLVMEEIVKAGPGSGGVVLGSKGTIDDENAG